MTGTNKSQTVNIGQTAQVFEGKPVTLHCPAKGIPKPDISWKFEGKDIKYVTGVNMMVDSSGGGLMIVEVTKKIAGTITCIAENVLGSSEASSRIQILSKLAIQSTTDSSHQRIVPSFLFPLLIKGV